VVGRHVIHVEQIVASAVPVSPVWSFVDAGYDGLIGSISGEWLPALLAGIAAFAGMGY
jgi:hypothetical protein